MMDLSHQQHGAILIVWRLKKKIYSCGTMIRMEFVTLSLVIVIMLETHDGNPTLYTK